MTALFHTRATAISEPVRDRDYWGRLHIASDRNPPIFLLDRRVRRSVGTATCWRDKGSKGSAIYE